MKNRIIPVILSCLILLLSNCKKDVSKQQVSTIPATASFEKGVLGFHVNGELMNAVIDTFANTITTVVPDSLNMHSMSATFSFANQVNASINNIVIGNSGVFDFSKPVTVVVSSLDRKRSTSFTLTIQNFSQFIGLTGTLIAQKSLNKSYNFYYDQFDGISMFPSIDCGPTVSTMAIKWADSTFNKSPADARNSIESNGGDWYTGDIQLYLTNNGISNKVDTLENIDSLVKTNIDNNRLVILCLDMFKVSLNDNSYQHIQKFYDTNAPGWGHFLLVKGYKLYAGGEFFLEIYDPYSDGQHYPGFDAQQLKGLDRYYNADNIFNAATGWWPYVISVAAKGTKITTSSSLTLNSLKTKSIPVAYGR